MRDDLVNCELHFQSLSSLKIKEIHPITRARFFISKLLFSEVSSELLGEIKYWCDYELKNKKYEPPYFHVWIMEGMILMHRYEFVLELSNSIKDDAYFQFNRINNGLIERVNTYRAFALIKTNQFIEGKKLYKNINTNEYDLFSFGYDGLFYLALTYHLSTDKKIKIQGQEKAKELGYEKLFQMLIAS